MNWVFKKQNIQLREKDEQLVEVLFEQKRNFGGAVGENVLFLEYDYRVWKFTKHYEIINIEVNTVDDYKQIKVIMRLIDNFGDEKLLSDYIYSLLRINNYLSPIRHFRGNYSRLRDEEYKAILWDHIYVNRTILGTVLNAFPVDHQRAFLSFATAEKPEIWIGKIDIDEVLVLLKQYIEYAIIIPARLLKESVRMFSETFSHIDIVEVGFVNIGDNSIKSRPQLLKPQLEIIDQYLESLESLIVSENRENRIEISVHHNFRRLFKNAPLPITIK